MAYADYPACADPMADPDSRTCHPCLCHLFRRSSSDARKCAAASPAPVPQADHAGTCPSAPGAGQPRSRLEDGVKGEGGSEGTRGRGCGQGRECAKRELWANPRRAKSKPVQARANCEVQVDVKASLDEDDLEASTWRGDRSDGEAIATQGRGHTIGKASQAAHVAALHERAQTTGERRRM